MEAVTRKEKILDGQDLTPLNRKEYFMKKAVSEGGGGSVPTPADADTGKVLTANNGAVVWKPSVTVFDTTVTGSVYSFNSTWQDVKNRFMAGLTYVRFEDNICAILAVREAPGENMYQIRIAMNSGLIDFDTNTPLGYPTIDLD